MPVFCSSDMINAAARYECTDCSAEYNDHKDHCVCGGGVKTRTDEECERASIRRGSGRFTRTADSRAERHLRLAMAEVENLEIPDNLQTYSTSEAYDAGTPLHTGFN